MHSNPSRRRQRAGHSRRRFLPGLLELEPVVVPSLAFPGIAGIAFDAVGDVFVSYDSTTRFSGQQQSVAEVGANGFLVSTSVFGTTGASAFPGTLTPAGSSTLPNLPSTSALLELQPNGQLFAFDPSSGASSQYDNLASDTASMSKVYNVQTGTTVNLAGQISLANATYGDLGVYKNSIVVSAESNNWDFVMRVTYGASGTGTATVLAASPVPSGVSTSPQGVAVDTQGTVLATMPYVPAGSSSPIDVPVGFNLLYDTGSTPAPTVPKLGLASVPDIESAAIAVDAENNFILAVNGTSLYGGGPGVVHINAALSAFLADPLPDTATAPAGMAYQNVGGTNRLAYTDAASDTYTVAGEIPLFSGQVTAAQLRHAYGVDQITFSGSGGKTVAGDGTGQTIAIVEEGVDPTLGADLATFDQFFGIPAPPSFKVLDQNNVSTPNNDIVGEASLDVEWAHAIAPGASIVVYNAAYNPNDPTGSFENLLAAMKQASELPGVSVVSLSYGEPESSLAGQGINEQSFDSDFTTPGVTFLAASGDSGIFGNGGFQVSADYPSASPNIVSVGGTSIVIDAAGDYPSTGTSGEVAWGNGARSGETGGGGGGLSSVEPESSWQSRVVPSGLDPESARALPDVSMDSGSAQEYDVFTSTLSGSSVSASAVGWLGDAGTSAAAPIWAGLVAIVDQGRVLAGGTQLTGSTQTLPALYALPAADFHDIVNGNNGDPAGPGYDLATGLGTPVANLLVPALADYGLPGPNAVQTQVTVQPPSSSPVAGQQVTLNVTVKEVSPGSATPTGTVTFTEGSTPLGTASLVNGSAAFSFSPSAAGAQTITVAYGGDFNDKTSSAELPLTVGQGTATLSLGHLHATYNGSAQYAAVTTDPSSLSGLAVTYTLNGVAVANPTHAGDYTVTATLTNPNYSASPVTGTFVISPAAPTVSWPAPDSITVGTALGAAELDATASFRGAPLAGPFTYSPAAGSVLPVGNQTLTVTFTPADPTDFQSVTSSVTIAVVPQPAPPQVPVTIVSEQPVFERKHNKKGKPIGKPVLVGFTLQFSTSLDPNAASNAGNYALENLSIKRVRRTLERVLRPLNIASSTYDDSNNAVTLTLAGAPSFANGGELTISPAITGTSNSVLVGPTVFAIGSGGKTIEPA
jgi:hypothetical protein